jgi:hypothetical protein
MMRKNADDERHDRAVEDSFPASDPPASTGITGPRTRRATQRAPQRDDESRPKGTPNHERHTTETAYHREHEDPSQKD